jgi:transcriptional regulator with XRE-family HTH domain
MDLNSAKIRELRIAKAWTQQQLAEISSLSIRTIQRVETQGLGSLETSKSLAAAFEVDRDILLRSINSSAYEDRDGPSSSVYFLLASFICGSIFGALTLWAFT